MKASSELGVIAGLLAWGVFAAAEALRQRTFLTGRARLRLGNCLCLLALVAVTGCSHLGPRTVPRDRFDYSHTLSESWKRQNLLNIVKLRYLDPPIFVDVGQIVAGYSLETGMSAGVGTANQGGSDAFSLGGSAKFTDRPTITYTPLTGNKVIKSLMTPLPPDGVLFTVQAGWPASAVLFAGVAAMNGLKNQEATIDGVTPPDPDFLRALELLRSIQLSGAVGIRIQQDAQKQSATVLTFRAQDASEQTLADCRELRGLLGLNPDASEFKVVFGATASNDRELALQTRSMLHIMNNIAAQVEIPPEDVAQGRTSPGFEAKGPSDDRLRLVRIHSSKSKPADAYVTVPYRNHWFWIDDRDLKSKRTFAFLMMLFTLAETGEKENLPVLTIPTQ